MEELAKLRRLQAATLLALVATLGVSVYGRFLRPAGPSVESIVERELERRAPARPEPPDVMPVFSSLAARLDALERRPAPRGASVLGSFDRRFVCRVTNSKRGLVAEVQEADGAPVARVLQSAADGRLELPREVEKLERPALLFAQALVRTDNGIREPLRLALACSAPGGPTREVELAGGFFAASKVLADDLVLKTEANTCVFAVAEGSRLELVLDVAKLKGSLKEGGLFEVLVRLGPIVLLDGGAAR